MYVLVKILTHFTIWLTCKRFSIYNRGVTETETPLVIGCHHPNSFLDAILVGAQMKKRVHFLTRSDVFKNSFAIALMRSVNMIPIYRIRDGKENLSNNDVTFNLCLDILKRGEHVLIFVEGFCKHQTTLQTPLKKGAPRLLVQSWKDGTDVQLLPVWLRFNSFRKFPKEVDINFGIPFGKTTISSKEEEGWMMQAINKETERQLLELSAIAPASKQGRFSILLLLPAVMGFVLHLPLLFPIHLFAKGMKETIHYDSVMFSTLALLYPFYTALIAGIVLCTLGWQCSLLTVLGLPLLARSYTLWK